jgi:hypothetical protein
MHSFYKVMVVAICPSALMFYLRNHQPDFDSIGSKSLCYGQRPISFNIEDGPGIFRYYLFTLAPSRSAGYSGNQGELQGCPLSSVLLNVYLDHSDHYLVVAKVRERLAVNKQRSQSSYRKVQSQEVKRCRG